MTFKPRLGTLLIILPVILIVGGQQHQSSRKPTFCLEPCLCHGNRISCRDADLEEIPPFQTINGANIVDLSKNNILTVDKESFSWRGTIQLQFLFLSANAIVYVESGAFDELLNLEHVDLSNNELQFVPVDIVAENSRIRVLNLAQNMLVHQVPIIISDSLQVLDLSWNKLDTILPESFTNLTNLERLELQSNNFQYIAPDIFHKMPTLNYVDLNINMWTCNCSTQILFDFVTSRGLFNITAPIICRDWDGLTTNEIYLIDGVTVGKNYCYEKDNLTILIDPNDVTVLTVDDINAMAPSVNDIVKSVSKDLKALSPDDIVKRNLTTSVNDLTASDVVPMVPNVVDITRGAEMDRNHTTITVYHLRYSLLNIVNLMVFIVFMVFVAKMLVMCVDVCRSVSDVTTEDSLLYKGTQRHIV